MKASIFLKSTFLASIFVLTSCATTKYSNDPSQNSFSNLQAGKKYVFTLKDASKEKMIFHRIQDNQIIGARSKKDTVEFSIEKNNVISAKDKAKANVTTGAVIIGAAGAAALIISSSRAD